MPNEDVSVNLNEILTDLDIEARAQKYMMIHMALRETYGAPNLFPQTYEEFMSIMMHFYARQWLGRLGLSDVKMMDPDYARGLVIELMDKAFGDDGLEYAFNIARTGVEGGFKTVMDKVYEVLLRQEEERYMMVVLDKVVGLDLDKKTELMRQYIRRYGNYLPEGAAMKKPEYLAANCERIIRHHVKMMDFFRTRMSSFSTSSN